jgi:hypothetical protein
MLVAAFIAIVNHVGCYIAMKTATNMIKYSDENSNHHD